jgi:hypothetical protein
MFLESLNVVNDVQAIKTNTGNMSQNVGICRILILHKIVINFSLLPFILWPCFLIQDLYIYTYLIPKEPIESQGNILDLKPNGI